MGENLDLITIGESLIELSSDKSLTYAEVLNKYYGGDTLCSAITALRLGSKCGYITRVGLDHFKEFLLDNWQSEGLDISQVKLIEGHNGIYFVANTSEKEKEFSFYRRKTAASYLSTADINENYIKTGSIFYATGIVQSLSLSAKEAVLRGFELSKKHSLTTAYAPNYNPKISSTQDAYDAMEEVVELVDIMFLNMKHDVEPLFKISSIDLIIKQLADRGVSTIVVKSATDGGYFVGNSGDVNFIPFHTRSVVDTTASQDAFNGAFLHAISSGKNCIEATNLANITANLQAQKIGVIRSIPTKEEILNELKRQ